MVNPLLNGIQHLVERVTKLHRIPYFEGYYATHDGKIYSFKTHKFLTTYIDNLGYEMVILYDNNGKRKYRIFFYTVRL